MKADKHKYQTLNDQSGVFVDCRSRGVEHSYETDNFIVKLMPNTHQDNSVLNRIQYNIDVYTLKTNLFLSKIYCPNPFELELAREMSLGQKVAHYNI